MNEVYAPSFEKFQEALDNLQLRLNKLHTGRACPALVENIPVHSYGGVTPLKHLAQINVEGASTLWVTPFDPQLLNPIEKAIRSAQLGFNPSIPSANLIRIQVPGLTEERRKEMVRQVKAETEQTAILIRNVRRQFKEKWKLAKKEKAMSEDEVQTCEKTLQRSVDEAIKKLEMMEAKKEQEIISV